MSIDQHTEYFVNAPVSVPGKRISWPVVLWTAGILVALAIFTCLFYVKTFSVLTTPESMDVAQIARNMSEGQGFTTRFVRPFNVAFYGNYQGSYPELNHSPAFPYVVSMLFKLHGPSDQTAAWASLIFALLSIGSTYFLGKILFGWRVGLLSATVCAVSYSVLSEAASATEWSLAAFLFTMLLTCVSLYHRSTESDSRVVGAIYSGLTALLAAALYLTNPILFVLAVPLAIYFFVTGPSRRLQGLVFTAIFVLAAAPWAVRNARITGFPVLGATAWDIMSNTTEHPGNTLYRTTESQLHSPARAIFFPAQHFPSFARKLATGSADSGGAMAGAVGAVVVCFAAVSVLYRFKVPAANAVRGLMYGAVPLLLVCYALYGISKSGAIVVAPVISVFGCAYLMLLIEAKKLHPFFAKVLIGLFIGLTAFPAVVAIVWGTEQIKPETALKVDRLLANPQFESEIVMKTPLYTDRPWAAAWRTRGHVVWLPFKDEDITNLEAEGLPMNAILLTAESDKLGDDEVWKLLHQSEVWRVYLEDPKKGLQMILGTLPSSFTRKLKDPEKILDRFARKFSISDSIRGFANQASVRDPLGPDDVQLLLRKGPE